MSNRHVIVLGTASQAPTRHRAHNGIVVRWDDQLFLFDPGEGTQRQAILANVAIARLTAIFITHFHGDHCLGLPGVIQRRALDARSAAKDLGPLPVFYPGAGQAYFDNLTNASEFHNTANIVPKPIAEPGVVETVNGAALGAFSLTAHPLEHRTTTFGYRLQEPARRRFNTAELDRLGIAGPDVGRLARQGWLDTPEVGRVELDDVSEMLPGQSMAFVMDTAPCAGAAALAHGVDLLICESTYLESEAALAAEYRHMTAAQAATLAVTAGAKRLVLGHFSARYPDNSVFAAEAASIHPDVVAASDLDVINFPAR